MYYGIDSDTAVFPTGATTKDFYAGRIGYGQTANSSYFNVTGANLASHRYGYWGIQGPTTDPNYSASTYTTAKAISWGKAQASSACTARDSINMSHPGRLNCTTIFGDIESGFGGWLSSSSASINYAVFQGFITLLRAVGNGTTKGGVYTSRGSWQSIMGTSLSPGYADYVWGANYPSGSTFNNPPSSMSGCYSINGATPTIWQYYGETGTHNPSVTGDANIMSSLPI